MLSLMMMFQAYFSLIQPKNTSCACHRYAATNTQLFLSSRLVSTLIFRHLNQSEGSLGYKLMMGSNIFVAPPEVHFTSRLAQSRHTPTALNLAKFKRH